MRLIDADALYASIAKDTYLLTDRINSRDYGMFLVGIKEKFDNAPAVQADRPHGEWIPNNDGSWDCSECGLRVFIYAKGNYCPNCGARMKGGDPE